MGKTRNVLAQCTARTRQGKQCGNGALPGTTVCRMHGGAAPQVQRKVQLAVLHNGLRKLVAPIEQNDPESDMIFSFDMEHRRTIARIRYFDEKITELKEEKDLVWGVTKETVTRSGEFPGIDTVYEARLNSYYEAQFRERQHLTDLHKLWITAKLDEKRLALEADVMDRLEAVISSVIVGLGRNAGDPEVRMVVRQAMLPVAT